MTSIMQQSNLDGYVQPPRRGPKGRPVSEANYYPKLQKFIQNLPNSGYFYTITVNFSDLRRYIIPKEKDLSFEVSKLFGLDSKIKVIQLIKEYNSKGRLHAHGVIVSSNALKFKKLKLPGLQVHMEKLRKFFTMTIRPPTCLCQELDPEWECPHRNVWEKEVDPRQIAWFHYIFKKPQDYFIRFTSNYSKIILLV